MDKKLIMMKGLPGSGKSTFAKKFVQDNPDFVRINNDDLRLTFFNRAFSDKDSNFIHIVREKIMTIAAMNGKSIIVDNCNLKKSLENDLRKFATNHHYEFQLIDYSHIDPCICIERDKGRENPVGEEVIMSMYNRFLKVKS